MKVIDELSSEDLLLSEIDKTVKSFSDGDIVVGTVVRVYRDEVLVDVGYKTEGVIPVKELSLRADVDPNELLEVGSTVEALVFQKEDSQGRLILSKKRAQYEKAWSDLEKIKDSDLTVTGKVIEIVRGGLIVDIGLRGFLPASLIDIRRVRDLSSYLGMEIEAKVLELDRQRNNVVLSRRVLLEQNQSEARTSLFGNLHKGQVRKGTVSSIVSFGAFVDLGGIDGLVHISEISWKHVTQPSEVLKVGEEVTVEILEVDSERHRVSLSLRATQEDPWQVFAHDHAIGQIMPGVVTKVMNFGVFVRLAEDVEGLAHVSELLDSSLESTEDVFSPGDEVFVKIVDIDIDSRRISLSLKQATAALTLDSKGFDPALYGMLAEYDDDGNYKYPEGFDPEANQWKEGFEEEKARWEQGYAVARDVWHAHTVFVSEFQKKLEALSVSNAPEALPSAESVSAIDSDTTNSPEPAKGSEQD
ncbi:30S ribosomal protein S1 [Tropheryma whipplei]|uniref:30S ribosomal protein S1 n=1 Tax=Tropheryma whipplei TaxID=2039 RepID=UPI0004BADA44|nr:30S ribosomal protein S1 [Tropheryma whipplei]